MWNCGLSADPSLPTAGSHLTGADQPTQRIPRGSLVSQSFLKTTERQPRSAEILSQSSSSEHDQRPWHFTALLDTHYDEANTLETLLAQHGMLDPFTSFEHFREVLVDCCADPHSLTSRARLLQATLACKHQLQSLSPSSSCYDSTEEQDWSEVQSCFLQLSRLRRQNGELRAQLRRLLSLPALHKKNPPSTTPFSREAISIEAFGRRWAEEEGPDQQDSTLQNSLLDNSLFFCGSSNYDSPLERSPSSSAASQPSSGLLDQRGQAAPDFETSMAAVRSAQHCGRCEGEIILSRENCFRAVDHSTIRAEYNNIIEPISRAVRLAKSQFCRQFSATAVALKGKCYGEELAHLRATYLSFRPQCRSGDEEAYLRESNRLLELLQKLSCSLARLVEGGQESGKPKV